MKILVIGGRGTIGSAVVKKLEQLDHSVISASQNSSDIKVDITSTESIEKMYQEVGALDAVVCAGGRGVLFKPITEMTKKSYLESLQAKLLGQIDVVLTGLQYLNSNGSFTLTSGILNGPPLPKGSAGAIVNSGIEAFVKAGSLELPKKMRLNVVNPGLVEESVKHYGELFVAYDEIPVKKVASAYVRSIVGILNGEIIKVWS
ncbi:MAG: hypothetical protein S4CHLAM7_11930 [Chlamydiae bacterium]|nr:hypothetical protein [Chlamydiota bacterium]